VHAARDLMAQHGALYPDWTLADWIANAKRRLRLSPSGKIGSDYDPRIAQAFTAPEELADADAWDAWLTFKSAPLVLIRGELSDLLTDAQAEAAIAALDRAELVTVPRVGHAPLLDEPEARAAIDALIDRVEAADLRT
jgi:pimeloyl-ACP methyl ester carboxylesterase